MTGPIATDHSHGWNWRARDHRPSGELQVTMYPNKTHQRIVDTRIDFVDEMSRHLKMKDILKL